MSKETPEISNWVYGVLQTGGISLPTVEGFSVKGKEVTGLFERLKSSVDVEEWTDEEICNWIELQDREANLHRTILASALQVPLYLVLWQHEKDKFRILSSTVREGNRIEIEDRKLFASCKEFSEWIAELKGIEVTKAFVKYHRLSSIDRCLRKYKVPWPGNLDGFLINPTSNSVSCIFEFRRTQVYSVKNHNLNKYFHQDFHGWEALDILKSQLNVPCYVLTWSSDETIVKIQKLLRADRELEFEKKEFLSTNQIVPWFSSKKSYHRQASLFKSD